MTGVGFPWDMVGLALLSGIFLGIKQGKKERKLEKEQQDEDSSDL